MSDERFTLRSRNPDGTINEVTDAAQALDLAAAKAIAYTPHDERLLIDDDGTVTHRQSAVTRHSSGHPAYTPLLHRATSALDALRAVEEDR